MRRPAAYAVLGTAVSLLAACQPDGSSGGDRARAMSLLRVDDAMSVFSDICLAKHITLAEIKTIVGKADFGLQMRYQTIRAGNPLVTLVGGETSPGGEFARLGCAVHVQGDWAGTMVSDVSSELAAQGFRTVSPFQTEKGKLYVPPVETLDHTGVFQRDGQRFSVMVRAHMPGRTATHRYIAHTALSIVAVE